MRPAVAHRVNSRIVAGAVAAEHLGRFAPVGERYSRKLRKHDFVLFHKWFCFTSYRCCSLEGNEAEVFFAPESASSRRRLPFLNTPRSRTRFERHDLRIRMREICSFESPRERRVTAGSAGN